MGKTEHNTLSKTESSLSKSDVFVEPPLIRVQRSEDREYFGTKNDLDEVTVNRQVVVFYLFSGQGIQRMPQGDILALCCVFDSFRSHIFVSIEKFGSHV